MPTDAQPVVTVEGDSRAVLAALPDGCVQAVITDPPYSERTHKGHDSGGRSDGAMFNKLGYGCWTQSDIDAVVPELCRVCSGWVVVMTDDVLAGPIGDAMRAAGRYVFAPLPFYAPGSRVRLTGDGPSSWTVWIVVCRTKFQVRWGTLPGGYLADGPLWRNNKHMGGKPTALMRALVRDYSRPGDTVLDPFAGGGTTGVACFYEGRRCLMVEADPATVVKARTRVEKLRSSGGLIPYTPPKAEAPKLF